jgi:hypothetical protein
MKKLQENPIENDKKEDHLVFFYADKTHKN